MRGRKHVTAPIYNQTSGINKKRIPEWGDGNGYLFYNIAQRVLSIKKESPNEGTETRQRQLSIKVKTLQIKKESPNEGTETSDGDHSVRAPLDIE